MKKTTGTALHRNAFCILGATTRDKKTRLVELSEEKNLVVDSDVCTKAYSALTVPRKRLSEEIAWLPGLSPQRANELLDTLHVDIHSLKGQSSLPPLANANLLAAAFEIFDHEMDNSTWCEWILDFAEIVEAIDPEDVARDINEDHEISGFLEVSIADVEEELIKRRQYYKETVNAALNNMPTMKLVEVVTKVVDDATSSGEMQAPLLIYEMIDSYCVRTQDYLQKEADNVLKLIEGASIAASKGIEAVKPLIERIDSIVRKWDLVAQPIQLSMKAHGQDHDLSHTLAYEIRNLSIELFNQYGMVEISNQLIRTLQDVFAELPEVSEKLGDDIDTIEDIIKSRQESQQRKEQWEREIYYEAEIGIVFKDKLKISSKGIEWKGKLHPLESISWVSWGAIRNSTNGIPTGTDYKIAFGNNQYKASIDTRRDLIYSNFTDRLWKSVCVRLISETLEALREGKRIEFSDTTIDDHGVFLKKRKFIAEDEVLYLPWDEVSYWSENGSLYISSTKDRKIYSSMSYLYAKNAHILETIIRLNFKNWKGRLSGLLED